MKLQYFHSPAGNFGDDVNPLLWREILGPMTHAPGSVELWGVGTLLGDMSGGGAPKVILGSGGGPRTRRFDPSTWDVRWVRGPLTASRLGLPVKKGMGDPAILWSRLQNPTGPDTRGPVGLVPHWKTAADFDWVRLAREAGLQMIDPAQSPVQVVEQMSRCSRVLTESLHGAIFADTLGIPWAPVVLAHRFDRYKWLDWLATVDREFTPFVMDRPLVRAQARQKAVRNRVLRALGVSYKSFNPQLRPVRVATAEDVQQVSRQLGAFARDSSRYACSSEARIRHQRQLMLQECERAAVDYGVAYLKAA